jgi:two-component system, OmpR family, sensor kinase
LAQTNNSTIHVTAPGPNHAPAPLTVTGHQGDLHRLITNLITNAIVHAPGTPIVVTLTQDMATTSVVLEVSDGGPGISREDRTRVFDRFTRVDSARARTTGGSGLGLSIAQAIAHDHSGTITFVDPPAGQVGACARVALPA